MVYVDAELGQPRGCRHQKTVNNTSQKKVASIIKNIYIYTTTRIERKATTMRRSSIKKTMTTCMTKLQQDFLAILRKRALTFLTLFVL